jgi:hypothetical protein
LGVGRRDARPRPRATGWVSIHSGHFLITAAESTKARSL